MKPASSINQKESKAWKPWQPPFHYDEVGSQIRDSAGHLIIDMRGWGFLTGRGQGGMKIPDDDAAKIQDDNGKWLVEQMNRRASVEASQPAGTGEWTAEKLEAVTVARRELSNAMVEQTMGLRDDINEVSEQILSQLYDAGSDSSLRALEAEKDKLEKALRALRLRHESRPAWFKHNTTTDNPYWWVTNFTYEQMEGNRLNTIQQIDNALAEPPIISEKTATETEEK